MILPDDHNIISAFELSYKFPLILDRDSEILIQQATKVLSRLLLIHRIKGRQRYCRSCIGLYLLRLSGPVSDSKDEIAWSPNHSVRL